MFFIVVVVHPIKRYIYASECFSLLDLFALHSFCGLGIQMEIYE
jgi:hypothetical protein